MPAPEQIEDFGTPYPVLRCRAKAYHADKKAARTVLNHLLRRHLQRGQIPGLTVYHCQVCGGWHLTKRGARKIDLHRDAVMRRLEHRSAVREYARYIAARRSREDLHQMDLAA